VLGLTNQIPPAHAKVIRHLPERRLLGRKPEESWRSRRKFRSAVRAESQKGPGWVPA